MQKTFDWSRAEQLGALDAAVVPKRPGVSSAACKAVLRAIDSHGRGRECWPSEATIAAESGLSVRTVKRAVRALVELSVLCVERRGVLTLNHYRIVWSELALLKGQKQAERSAMVSERSAMVSERSAMVSERSAMVAPETYNKRTEKRTTNDVLLLELMELGLAKAEEALSRARAAGLSDADIRARVDAWQALRPAQQTPGVLFNWLAVQGSWRSTTRFGCIQIGGGRGDALTRDQVERNRIRFSIVRAGRAAGADPAEIDRRCELAGV